MLQVGRVRELTAVDALRHDPKIADLPNLGSRRTSRFNGSETFEGFKRQRGCGGDEVTVDIIDLSLGLEVDAEAVLRIHLEAVVDGEIDIQEAST